MSEIGGDEPRELPEGMTVGEFMDGLPSEVPTHFYARGQWWEAKKMDLPMPGEDSDD